MKKRLSTILATLLMTVTLIPFAPVHAKAASADVTTDGRESSDKGYQ